MTLRTILAPFVIGAMGATLAPHTASGGVGTGQAPAVGKPHAEMEKLAFLIGSWDIQIQALDRAGNVIQASRGHLDTTSELGGQLVLSLGYSDARTPAQRNWKFYHRAKQILYDVNFDLVGNFEVREQVGAGSLAFALVEPFRGTDGVPRNWRKTYRPVSADAYEVVTDYSENDAEWVLAFRERYTRRGGVR